MAAWAGCDCRTIRHREARRNRLRRTRRRRSTSWPLRALSAARPGAAPKSPARATLRPDRTRSPAARGGLGRRHLDRHGTDDSIREPQWPQQVDQHRPQGLLFRVTVASMRSEVSARASAARSTRISVPVASARNARILASGCRLAKRRRQRPIEHAAGLLPPCRQAQLLGLLAAAEGHMPRAAVFRKRPALAGERRPIERPPAPLSDSIVPRPPLCCHDSGAISLRTIAASSATVALSSPVRLDTV